MKRATFGLILGLGIFSGGYHLFAIGKLSETAFCGILILAVAVGFAASGHLKEFKIWGAHVVLRKTEKIQQDIVTREARIRAMALLTADIVGLAAALHMRALDDEHHELNSKWSERKIRELLKLAQAEGPDAGRGLRFLESVKAIEARGVASLEGQRLWGEFWATVKRETQ